LSKRVKHYYACDYCAEEIDNTNKSFAYTDNSGYRSKTFDLCCNDCLNDHLEYIQNEIDKGNIEEKTIEEYKQKYIKSFWT
jgi:hypothetical protein